jgi:DNA-binding Lrp family transcriptional regulator
MQTTKVADKPESVAKLPSYIFASVEPRALNSVVEQLRKEQGIKLIAPTSGRHNLVVQLNSNETANVYSFVNKVRSTKGVRGTRTLIPLEGHLTERKALANEAVAFVLLRVQEQPGKVLEQLKQTPIHSACVVPGEFDIVATVSGRDHNEVMERAARMAEIPGVEESETLFAYKPIWA